MFYHYYYNWDTIPKDVSHGDAAIELLVSNGEQVHKGNSIVRFHFPHSSFDLVSEYDGFVCGVWWRANEPVEGASPIHNVLLLSISTEPLDDLQYRFPSVYSITQDSFTSERIISWERVAGFHGRYYRLSSRRSFALEFDIKDQVPILNLYYPKKDARLRKSDSVAFHFEDGTIIR